MARMDHLQSARAPHVHLSFETDGAARRALAKVPKGWMFKTVDGARCRSKAGLLAEFARALDFPEHFGKNWDAFEECLSDLEWLPARGYRLLITDGHEVLAEAPKDYATFVDILETVGREWAQRRHTVFHAVIAAPAEKARARRNWRARELKLDGRAR
jgi:hypothetical protein